MNAIRSDAPACVELAMPAHLPLLAGPADRPLLWRAGTATSAAVFLAQAQALAKQLPTAPNLINLCEDRGHFLLGFAAALLSRRCTLLPPSRAPRVVAEIASSHGPAGVLDDATVIAAITGADVSDADARFAPPLVETERVVAIGFTSGSTGAPKANAKTWGAFAASTRLNRQAFEAFAVAQMNVLATVPSQHMYGMETCVLLPVLGDVAVAVDRPMFPLDLVEALAALPRPRLLVTTPVHLRAFVAADLSYPSPDLIVSATAPLDHSLAQAAEKAFGAPLLEVFGSTETCVIGHRRTANEADWQLYPGLRLESVAEGTLVHAPYYAGPVLLHDHVCMLDAGRFVVEGRCQDMIEIGGKRASLGDIGLRLLAVPGVSDAAVIQESDATAGIQRLIAFVVAPEIDDAGILTALRTCLDPVFLPRRLIRVENLPRNETGKLRRDQLLALLARG